jgi:hypothetical protein
VPTHLYLLTLELVGSDSGGIGLRQAPPPFEHIPLVLPLFWTHPLPHDVQTSAKLPAPAASVLDDDNDDDDDDADDCERNARVFVSATENGVFGVPAEMVVLTRTEPASGKNASLTKMLTVVVVARSSPPLPSVGMEQFHTCVMDVSERDDAPARTHDDGETT